MSEMWRGLIDKKHAELAGLLSVRSVKINRQGTELCVMLRSDRLLSGAEYDYLLATFRGAFPGAKASLKVSYPALGARLSEDGKALDYLKTLVCSKSPATRPILERASLTIDGETAQISVSDEPSAEYLRHREIDRVFTELTESLFERRCVYSIAASGDAKARMEEIERRQREDEARLVKLVASEISTKPSKPSVPRLLYGKQINDPAIDISELTEDAGRVTLKGEVLSCETRSLKNDTTQLISFIMTDYTGSVGVKLFAREKGGDKGGEESRLAPLMAHLKKGAWVKARGKFQYDSYQREMVIMADDIMREDAPVREDRAERKRVELHCHTFMSTMDATMSPTAVIEQAEKWGHPGIAITDHGVLQAFPEAFGAVKKKNIKFIPGCEAYLIDDRATVVERADARPVKECAYVALDFETTGLSTSFDEIIEIGAVRFENGQEVGEFSQLINPGRMIPDKVIELTGITDAMVRDMPQIGDVTARLAEFCQGAVLVAHNASFDIPFLARAFRGAGRELTHPVLDTLALARNVYKGQKSYKLGAMCKFLGVKLPKAHRAVHDARAAGEIMLKALSTLSIERLEQLNEIFTGDAGGKSYHIILLAINRAGMTNLNRLVSEAHLHYFHRMPRTPRSLIEKYREGLIIGSACEAGELFRALVAGAKEAELDKIASFYDYLEIQPTGNNGFLIREGAAKDEEALRDYNRAIVRLGEKLNKPVVATTDAHFMNERDSVSRAILMAAHGFEDASEQPPLFFRTTDEMLAEFSYLGERKAMEVVVDNPNAILARVEEMSLFPKHPEGKETFQPFWPQAEEEIRTLCADTARELYGDPLPDLIQKRLDKELGAICGYGFSTLYDIAVKLIRKSLSDGYIVGSRGSVGSSFVAFLTGITEVNSLPPHYVCPKCKKVDFNVPKDCAVGLDLPERACPDCGVPMNRDGYDIPFEVFLGFKGDKVPDIDLNFSGVYQPVAHAYVKELFGAENVFRAGTIGTVAEKTAYGYVLKYLEERGLTASNAEKERLASGIIDAKRTTGQHPAGMVVLPKGYEIYQFTAIQHPADDMKSDVVTTHFDFASMHDVLVKLDILGHDDPTMLRKLQDMTGIAPQKVPLHDPEVFKTILSLFSSPKALGVTSEEIMCNTGTLGVPEFGTSFVRGMLEETKPSTMEELIRISGLSHGTAVWLGNIQDVIRSGKTELRGAICTRDDIMNQLIALGMPAKMAFDIMEYVRKGKGSQLGMKPEMEAALAECNAPEWFIGACKKIGYMFPKAHAAAYVLMALRIAYFKIYYPPEYYACLLTRNLDKFDASKMVTTLSQAKGWLDELKSAAKGENEKTEKEEDKATMLESVVELYARGVKLLPPDVYLSQAEDFVLDEDKAIRSPLCSLPGLGLSAALQIVKAREDGAFMSREDMARRKIPKSIIELLHSNGALGDMPESSQVSLFD